VLIDQIEKISLAVKMCHERLGNLQCQAKERSELEREEDSCREAMCRWCVRIRSIILVPSTPDLTESSRPSIDGSMSSAMLNVFREAEYLGIAKLPDVHQVANSFRCLAWSALAMQTLARKPSLKDVQGLVSRCHSLSLPDEKSIRMMKSMVQRTIQWQLRASKLLAPISGETRPFSMELLRNLQDTESEIPLEVPEMQIVSSSIHDKGKRHCLCGGPNDGTFMLGCDKCGGWFHGRCVNISKHIGRRLEKWLCMPCEGKPDDSSSRPPTSTVALESNDEEDSTCSIISNDIVPHAPVISKLWPPFGQLGSNEAITALGEECCMISDDIGPLIPPTKSSELVTTLPTQLASPLEEQPCPDLSLVTTLSPNPLIACENRALDLHPPIFQHHSFNGNDTWMAETNHVPSVHSMPTENAFANQDVAATTIIMET
jgi:PHD-finger